MRAACELVLIGRYVLLAIMAVPGLDQQLGEEAADGDKEGSGAHGRVANLEVQYLLGCWVRAGRSRSAAAWCGRSAR